MKKWVTQAQLQKSLARVRKDIKQNGAALKKFNSRVNSLTTRYRRDIKLLKAGLMRVSEMAILMLFLQEKPELEVTTEPLKVDNVYGPTGASPDHVVTNVSIKDTTPDILPLVLLMRGMGTIIGSDSDNMMQLLALTQMGK